MVKPGVLSSVWIALRAEKYLIRKVFLLLILCILLEIQEGLVGAKDALIINSLLAESQIGQGVWMDAFFGRHVQMVNVKGLVEIHLLQKILSDGDEPFFDLV